MLVYFGANFRTRTRRHTEADARRLQFEKSYQVRQALIRSAPRLAGPGLAQGDQTALGFCRRARRTMISFSPSLPRGRIRRSLVVLSCMRWFSHGIENRRPGRDRLANSWRGRRDAHLQPVFINIGMNIRIVPVTASRCRC